MPLLQVMSNVDEQKFLVFALLERAYSLVSSAVLLFVWSFRACGHSNPMFLSSELFMFTVDGFCLFFVVVFFNS